MVLLGSAHLKLALTAPTPVWERMCIGYANILTAFPLPFMLLAACPSLALHSWQKNGPSPCRACHR